MVAPPIGPYTCYGEYVLARLSLYLDPESFGDCDACPLKSITRGQGENHSDVLKNQFSKSPACRLSQNLVAAALKGVKIRDQMTVSRFDFGSVYNRSNKASVQKRRRMKRNAARYFGKFLKWNIVFQKKSMTVRKFLKKNDRSRTMKSKFDTISVAAARSGDKLTF